MGVVGLPNVGKSSLFNLLCEQACSAVRRSNCNAAAAALFSVHVAARCISRHARAQENCASLVRCWRADPSRGLAARVSRLTAPHSASLRRV